MVDKFDPLNKISLDAIISPKDIGERELAARHFLNLLPQDLVLLDRGYPAYWLFNLILSLDVIPLKLRLIRVELDTGDTEILITSLIDKDLYPTDIFMELYHKRWPVEDAFVPIVGNLSFRLRMIMTAKSL